MFQQDPLAGSAFSESSAAEQAAEQIMSMVVRIPSAVRLDLLIQYSARLGEVARGHSEVRS